MPLAANVELTMKGSDLPQRRRNFSRTSSIAAPPEAGRGLHYRGCHAPASAVQRDWGPQNLLQWHVDPLSALQAVGLDAGARAPLALHHRRGIGGHGLEAESRGLPRCRQ